MAYFCFCRMLGEQASDVGERRMSHTLRIGKVALTVQSAAHTHPNSALTPAINVHFLCDCVQQTLREYSTGVTSSL